jgi:hypothetical protein
LTTDCLAKTKLPIPKNIQKALQQKEV